MCWRSVCTRTIRMQVVKLETVGGLQPFNSDKAVHVYSPVFPNDWGILQPWWVYSLLCALFVLVVEPYRYEYCSNLSG